MVESPHTPDVVFKRGDKVLHYRTPTDEEEDVKLAQRWQHAVVDKAEHPSYVVRDATGMTLRANAYHLIPDLTALKQASLRKPAAPHPDKVLLRSDREDPVPGSVVILEELASSTEPWRVARVLQNQDNVAYGYIRIHYYNRYNRAAKPSGQKWKPSYFDPRDKFGRDVVTHSPKAWYEAYVEVVPVASVIHQNVSFNKNGTLSAADLRSISNSDRTQWVYNTGAVEEQELQIGTWILRKFGTKGSFVGRVTDVAYPRPHEDQDMEPVFTVLYEDQDEEIMTKQKALDAMHSFDSSGFARTKGWTKPKAGIRQLKRLSKKLRKRRQQAQAEFER